MSPATGVEDALELAAAADAPRAVAEHWTAWRAVARLAGVR